MFVRVRFGMFCFCGLNRRWSGVLRYSGLVLLAVWGGGLAAETVADDWPRWMGPHGDGRWRETGIIESFPETGPEIRWRKPIQGGYSGPAIVDGRVYITDRTEDEGKGIDVENDIRQTGAVPGGERVQCLDLETGETLWSHTYDCPYEVAYPTGPRCTPTVDGDHVYTLGAMGHLICFQRETGDIVWKKSLTGEYGTRPPLWGYSSHPLVYRDLLIVPVGGEGSGVVAFDKASGAEQWKAVSTLDVAYAPLVVYQPGPGDSADQLVFWHADGVSGLNPASGDEYWTIRFPEERNPSQTSIATPLIIDDRLLVSEFYKGSLLMQLNSDPPAAEEIWRSYRTDPRNKTALNSMITTPVVRDGYVYGIAYDARGRGVFRCLDLDSGGMVWTREDWMAAEPLTFASAFVVENQGRYWIFNDAGELMIVNLTPAGFEEIDRAAILEPTGAARGRKVVWSHPAFSRKCMVARNDQEIVCVDLSEK